MEHCCIHGYRAYMYAYMQGCRKVSRSGAAIYRGRAVADNFSSVHSAENFLTYPFFTYEET